MNYGPLIFLAAFFALATSWFGMVLTPHAQVGHLQPTNTVPDGLTYPVGRAGLARQGLDVYRANGCEYCHSQQVRQTGMVCDVLLTDAGTNQPAVIQKLLKLVPEASEASLKEKLASLPQPIKEHIGRSEAEALVKALAVGDVKAELWVVPVGPDISRGWGRRRTVAEDFLYDYPYMPGSQRVGPDLADVGARLPDVSWQLRHLYAPTVDVKGSPMPPYRYLFAKQKSEHGGSPEALTNLGDHAPPTGYEIVPRAEAKALVAYLLSLRANEALFDAPFTVPSAPATNAAPGTATNAAPVTATNAPAPAK
ncbi:MAG TPA: cbb3-type cytochrome c oxidase subunit II [Candidatus Dormibacteraeota bacterium]|nr:cbb3-type cytochrome c oxidase subunit II [Candidatus Dormibacteraeota bacterium]